MKTNISRSKNSKYKLPIYNAIRKYGLDSFDVSVISSNIENFEACSKLETEKIRIYRSIVPNGYNLTEGGEGTPGFKHTDLWKDLHSKRMKGNTHASGSKHTEDWKLDASNRMKSNTHASGTKHSEEFKEARRKRFLKKNPNKKFSKEQRFEIYQAYINMEHRSQRQIASKFGCSQDTVKKIFAEYREV